MSDSVHLRSNHLSKSKDVWHTFHDNVEDFFCKAEKFIGMRDDLSLDIPKYFLVNL